MPTPNSRLEPFVGYRVALTPEADASSLSRLSPPHPAVRALLAGQRSVTLPPREADAVYDAAESVSRALGEPFPLQFTPVRCNRGRALQFESVALSAERDPAPGARRVLRLGALSRGSNRRRPGLRRSTRASTRACRLCRVTQRAQPRRATSTP